MSKYLSLQSVVTAISFILLAILILTRASWQQLHFDEAIFIERGRFFNLYTQGDFDRQEWQDYDSFDVPKFAELFYGAAMTAFYQQDVQSVLVERGYYRANSNYLTTAHIGSWYREWTGGAECCFWSNVSLHRMEMVEPILVSRTAALLFFTLPLIALIYLVGNEVGGWWLGWTSMVLIGTNPLFLETMSTAMGDSPLWMFSFLFFYLSIRAWPAFAKIKTKKSRALINKWALVLGIVLGLAISTKLNGVLGIVYWMIYCPFLIIKEDWPAFEVLKLFFKVATISFLVFYLLNPFIWKKPLSGSAYMAQHRAGIIEYQQLASKEEALHTLRERFNSVLERTFLSEADYANFSGKTDLPVDLVLFVGGVSLLLYRLRSKMSLKLGLWVAWWGTLVLITIALIPLDWSRYYLPTMFALGFIEAYLISEVAQYLVKRFSPKK